MQTFKSFNALATENTECPNLGIFNPETENTGMDFTSNPDGTVSSGGVPPVTHTFALPNNLPPPIREWGNSVNARFDKVNARLDSVDARLDSVDARLDSVDARLDKLEEGMKNTATKTDLTALEERLTTLIKQR